MFSANSSQVSGDALYVEDVFSTYLYTGTNANQTITNNIDLSGKGGMVLLQCRSDNTGSAWNVYDTQRGAQKYLVSSGSREERTTGAGSGLTSFNSNGFTLGTSWNTENFTNYTYASWTFREAPKFFDVVTYTGNGSNRTIAHSLGAVPGCIIIKRLQDTYDWQVYHRSNANTQYMVLNSTAARATGATRWNSTTPTDTEFSLGTDATVNASGGTYVAYLFGHDTTSNGVVQCGSWVADGNPITVNLGWEPQFILWKSATGTSNWNIADQMRGLTGSDSGNGKAALLLADAADAETSPGFYLGVTPTGFVTDGETSGTYIYIAIRRGPMRTPTSGTTVFYPQAVSQADIIDSSNVPFAPDLVNTFSRNGTDRASSYLQFQFLDRLRYLGKPSNTFSVTTDATPLVSSNTAAESSLNDPYVQLKADGINITRGSGWNSSTYGNQIYYFFKRAPSFFDEVCYTGTGANLTLNHNLGAVPEMMIVKSRSGTRAWQVYSSSLPNTEYLVLNTTAAKATGTDRWNSTTPSSTTFTVGTSLEVNANGLNHVAYLFASCPGVSKVGSYTGNGSSQTINCGFAAGARFVLIKRTDSTGDWYVWDTARGIVSGNDPHLSLNSTAAEVTTDDSVDTDSSGFVVNQLSATNINVSSATYIYLAVA